MREKASILHRDGSTPIQHGNATQSGEHSRPQVAVAAPGGLSSLDQASVMLTGTCAEASASHLAPVSPVSTDGGEVTVFNLGEVNAGMPERLGRAALHGTFPCPYVFFYQI